MTFYLLDVVCVPEDELLAGVNVVVDVVVDESSWIVASIFVVAVVATFLSRTTKLICWLIKAHSMLMAVDEL